MKYIFYLTALILTLVLGKKEIENKYLYFSNNSLSNIDISCKKNDDCMLTRSLQRGCSHFIAVNKKLTQKEIASFNAKERIFWITKDVECKYPSEEESKKFKALCVDNVCGLSDGNTTYFQPPPSCGIDEKQHLEIKEQSLMWKKLKHGLWKDKHGNIGFKVSKALSDRVFVDRYITTIGVEEYQLKDVLDIETFERVGELSYYKDKNQVYMYYDMSGGGWFGSVEVADSASFKSMGTIYAKDKNHIYVERNGKIEVDYETFEVFETVGNVCCYAKDKNAYYMWGEKVKDIKSSEFLTIKKILDKQSVIKKKKFLKEHKQDEVY